jgi:hypothetical protein
LRYGGHRRRGLGPLQNAGQGFLEHVAIAVAADGSRLPLGVLAHKTIIRPLEPKRRRGTKRSRRAPDSESRKWEQVAESAEHAIEQENKLIHLMDREADIYGAPDRSVGHLRPGRGGQMPPSRSIARLISA